MNIGLLVGLGGVLGGSLLLVEFRQIGSVEDAALGAVGIIMLFVGVLITFAAFRR